MRLLLGRPRVPGQPACVQMPGGRGGLGRLRSGRTPGAAPLPMGEEAGPEAARAHGPQSAVVPLGSLGLDMSETHVLCVFESHCSWAGPGSYDWGENGKSDASICGLQ